MVIAVIVECRRDAVNERASRIALGRSEVVFALIRPDDMLAGMYTTLVRAEVYMSTRGLAGGLFFDERTHPDDNDVYRDALSSPISALEASK